MIVLSQYKNKHVAVFGLQRTGRAALECLTENEVVTYAWDDIAAVLEEVRRKFASKCNFIHPKDYDWENFSALVLSPGIPTTFPNPHWVVSLARQFNCPIKSDIQLFLESMNSVPMRDRPKVIGITGTNGKSTTTSLLTHVLNCCGIAAEMGGNIGIPVLELSPGKSAYVLEISSFQMDITDAVNLDASVLLNITPDHLDRHGTMENYINSKMRLLELSALAVIGVDNAESKNVYDKLRESEHNVIHVSGEKVLDDEGVQSFSITGEKLYQRCEVLGSLSNLQINLEVNALNIAAVCIIAKRTFNLNLNEVINAISSFKGLPHRCEFIGKFENAIFVNDSKSTNADSSEKTLSWFENILWIVGGVRKDEGINPLLCNSGARLTKIRKIYLIGRSTEDFSKALDKEVPWVGYEKCETLECAFNSCVAEVTKKENQSLPMTVLLSPICASFDQFNNYEDRGDFFRKLVESFLSNK